MTSELDNYICLDCGDNTFYKNEYYMVYDQVWDSVATDGMLCVECLEQRLGRILTSKDFSPYPINFGVFPQSHILYSTIHNDEY